MMLSLASNSIERPVKGAKTGLEWGRGGTGRGGEAGWDEGRRLVGTRGEGRPRLGSKASRDRDGPGREAEADRNEGDSACTFACRTGYDTIP
jgi:hypothetical protein